MSVDPAYGVSRNVFASGSSGNDDVVHNWLGLQGSEEFSIPNQLHTSPDSRQ